MLLWLGRDLEQNSDPGAYGGDVGALFHIRLRVLVSRLLGSARYALGSMKGDLRRAEDLAREVRLKEPGSIGVWRG